MARTSKINENKNRMKKLLFTLLLACSIVGVKAQDNVIAEVVWDVGDDAILRSDVESQRL